MMSAGTAGGITISGFSGLASADDCDYGESEAPFEEIKDAAETAICETNNAVEELDGRIEDLNTDDACAWKQESSSPHYIRLDGDCQPDVSFDGDGCGDTYYRSYNIRDTVQKYLWLSDEDAKAMADELETGLPLAIGFTAGAISLSGPAGGIVGLAAAVMGIASDEAAERIRDKNEGCGVGIHVVHPDFDRGEPLDDIVYSRDDYKWEIKTQSD